MSTFSSSGNNRANDGKDSVGIRNFDEWLADTDPSDPNSFFHTEAMRVESGVTTLQFQSSPIRRYCAQFTPKLAAQPFTDFLTSEGTGDVISITHTNSTGGFYRLQAEGP